MKKKKLFSPNPNVTRCFVLFSKGKSGVTEYHGIVINDEELAKRTCIALGKTIKSFVDYYMETRIY